MDRVRYNYMFFLFLTITQIFLFYVNLSYQSPSLDSSIHLNKREAQVEPTFNASQAADVLKCNGDSALCDLRYDQVTYPGTHNSAAYSLNLDCNQTVRNCLDSTSVCSKQYAQCIVTYGMQCDAQASACRQRNPPLLHWMCDGINKTCRSNNAVCAAWNAVCTNSYKVCDVWGDACKVDVPDWIITCFWENNPGFSVLKQLQDGIRLFDFDTCLVNNERAVLCHGMGPTRALGDELDPVLQVILDFMNANPNEVITLEFSDIDGDAAMISNYIQSKLKQFFVNETAGTSLLYVSTPNTPWITLREMISRNTRIVVFFGRIYNNVQDRQPWIHYTYEWFAESYSYTANDMIPQQISNTFIGYCSSSESVISGDMATYGRVRWQTIDDTVGIIPPTIAEAIKMGQNPGPICIKDLALQINFDVLKNIATYCYPKFPYYFRIRIDHYWQSSLFEVVKKFNELNVKRFLNTTTATNAATIPVNSPISPKKP